MFKNVASQKLIVFAFDATTNLPKTGDAANLTAYVSKDYGAATVLADTTATELDSTNAKGYYLFDLAQAETNADTLLFSAKSSTANIVVVGAPATVFTAAQVPDVNAAQISGDSAAADNLEAMLDGTGGVTLTAGIAGNVTGNLSGSVGSVTGAVGSVTGAVGSVTGAVGSVTGNVGGNVVGSVGSVTGNVGGNVTGSVGSVVAAVATTSNIKKNQALSNFAFLMTDSTTHAPATGKTVSVTRAIDNGAQGAGALSVVTEVGNGIYRVNFAAGDLNGNVIMLRATAAGCDDTFERIVTQP